VRHARALLVYKQAGVTGDNKTRKENFSISRRVVVTGVGLLSAVGDTAVQTWKALLACRNGISRIESFDASAFNELGSLVRSLIKRMFQARIGN